MHTTLIHRALASEDALQDLMAVTSRGLHRIIGVRYCHSMLWQHNYCFFYLETGGHDDGHSHSGEVPASLCQLPDESKHGSYHCQHDR